MRREIVWAWQLLHLSVGKRAVQPVPEWEFYKKFQLIPITSPAFQHQELIYYGQMHTWSPVNAGQGARLENSRSGCCLGG